MGLPCDRSRLDPREEARRVSAFSLVRQEILKPRKNRIVNRLSKKEVELAIGVDGRDWRTGRREFMGPTVALRLSWSCRKYKGASTVAGGAFLSFLVWPTFPSSCTRVRVAGRAACISPCS